ncbi:MAG: MFS transporter [Deltaproteobacteria bacterium]|nr:MFS transporter [Deltaproteobacteria bacterium]
MQPLHNDPPGKRRGYIFPLLHYFYTFSYWTYMIYLPLYFQELGLRESAMGALESAFPLTTLILIFPLGMLSDRLGAGSILKWGAFGVVVFSALMSAVHTKAFLPPLMIFGGAAFSLYYVSINALFFKHVGRESRGWRTAWFFAGGTIGLGTGPLLAGFLMERLGPGAIFLQGAAASAVMTLAALTAPEAPLFKIRLKDYFRDLKQPAAIIVTLTMFLIHTHVGFEQMGYALLMEHVVGLSRSHMGMMFTIIAAWLTFWSLVAGRNYDGGQKPVLVLGVTVVWSGIFQYLTAYSFNFASMALIRLAHSFGDSFFNVILLILVGTTFHRGRVGGNYGFILMINTAAMFLAHNASGFLMEGGRYGLPFMVSGAIMTTGGIVFLVFRNTIRKTLKLEGNTGATLGPDT